MQVDSLYLSTSSKAQARFAPDYAVGKNSQILENYYSKNGDDQ